MTATTHRSHRSRHLPLVALLTFTGAGVPAHATVAEWPEFRGPTGQGHTARDAAQLPLQWSATENVRWKQALPGTGWSSPVVARGRIFLTTGVTTAPHRASLRALALDAATGRVLWNTELVPDADISPQTIHKKNSPASPTPLIEGDRVYIHFGHHGTACLDLDGKIVW